MVGRGVGGGKGVEGRIRQGFATGRTALINALSTYGSTPFNEENRMKFLRKEDVCRELGISPRGLEKMVAEGRFPVPVRIGKRAVWSSAVER